MRSVEQYEATQPQHRGHTIGIARHGKCAPFACNAPLKLCIERCAIAALGEFVIVERCTHDGRIVNAWSVLRYADVE